MAGLIEAIKLAVEKHEKQKDKSGEPYILHPLRVMMKVRAWGAGEAAQCAAVMHDLIEDCGVTAGELRGMGFSEEVIAGVEAVTETAEESALKKLPGRAEEAYLKFAARAGANAIGKLVKIADIEDNMDVLRLKEVGEKDIARMNRYMKAWRMLRGK